VSNAIQKLLAAGQSVWCDNLGRRMIESSDSGLAAESLRGLIELGVVGVTSNPTIFMKSITGGDDYDDLLAELAVGQRSTVSIYEELVLPDIADAADLLRPVYERTSGVDGYVSLEVSPKLAYDTQATVIEARRLFRRLDRPNVFIKVPATPEGIPAVETLIAEGINVNITLIFSLAVYEKVMQAYIDGLRRLSAAGGDVSAVASVASFFVSRVDTLVDKLLLERRAAGADVSDVLGKAAVANAKLAYARFEEVFDSRGAFAALAADGARVQRPLWASTSTKNSAYADTKYVDGLIGPRTVNTMPPETIRAVLDHGRHEVSIRDDLEGARRVFVRLAEEGIDFDAVTDNLTVDGVAAFAHSFDELLANLERKKKQLRPVC